MKKVIFELHNEHGIEITEVDLAWYVVTRQKMYEEQTGEKLDVMDVLSNLYEGWEQEIQCLKNFNVANDPDLEGCYE